MGIKTPQTTYDRDAKLRKQQPQIVAQREFWRGIRWQGMVNADTALQGQTPDYVEIFEEERARQTVRAGDKVSARAFVP